MFTNYKGVYIVSLSLFFFLSLSLQGGSIQNTESQYCLELVESRQAEFGFQLAIQDCTGQKWTITNILTVLPQ